MTTEEKARAYDEALERAKEIKSKILSSHLSTESCKAVSEYIDEIVPELRESEDERIRKWLYDYIERVGRTWGNPGPFDYTQILAWLEKQKEHKQYDDDPLNGPRFLDGFDVGREVQKIFDEPKPAKWSKEYKETIRDAINRIEQLDHYWNRPRDEKLIKRLKSLRPSWKPSEDEKRLIITSISFLKDFADKGYENAVECIDWLKSKLNGNSDK